MDKNPPESPFGSCCLDGESGLFHQDHFRSVLAQELARLDRWERPLSLVVLEDSNPASVSNWALFGCVLKNSLRPIDLPARLGPRRAAVILPDADAVRVKRWLVELLANLESEGCCFRAHLLYGLAVARPWEGRQVQEFVAQALADLGPADLAEAEAAGEGYAREPATAIATEERNLLFAGFKTLGGSQNH